MCKICNKDYNNSTFNLIIYNCHNIIELPNDLYNIQYLEIKNCNKLINISKKLINLKILYITNCPLIKLYH